jgi:RNase adaptor protein for sRNA GlmZ degradation
MPLTITVTSFSFKKTPLVDSGGHGGGHVFDCRALPNPGREDQYKKQTGRDQPVIEYLGQIDVVKEFITLTQQLVRISVQNYLSRGFDHLAVSFGCTGGQHRSVYCAERMRGWLQQEFGQAVVVQLHHRDCPVFD